MKLKKSVDDLLKEFSKFQEIFHREFGKDPDPKLFDLIMKKMIVKRMEEAVTSRFSEYNVLDLIELREIGSGRYIEETPPEENETTPVIIPPEKKKRKRRTRAEMATARSLERL